MGDAAGELSDHFHLLRLATAAHLRVPFSSADVHQYDAAPFARRPKALADRASTCTGGRRSLSTASARISACSDPEKTLASQACRTHLGFRLLNECSERDRLQITRERSRPKEGAPRVS